MSCQLDEFARLYDWNKRLSSYGSEQSVFDLYYKKYKLLFDLFSGDNTRRVPASLMAGAQAARPARQTVHRSALGVPPANLDSGPVHLAVADHANSLRAPGDGLLEAL